MEVPGVKEFLFESLNKSTILCRLRDKKNAPKPKNSAQLLKGKESQQSLGNKFKELSKSKRR